MTQAPATSSSAPQPPPPAPAPAPAPATSSTQPQMQQPSTTTAPPPPPQPAQTSTAQPLGPTIPSPGVPQPSALAKLSLRDKLLLAQAVHEIGTSPPDWGKVSSLLLSHPLIRQQSRLEQAANAGLTLGRIFGTRECERAWTALMRQRGLVLSRDESIAAAAASTAPASSTAAAGASSETTPKQKEARGAQPRMDRKSQLALAKLIYAERIEELKESIKEKEQQFKLLIREIDDIKSGKADPKLELELRIELENLAKGPSAAPASATASALTTPKANKTPKTGRARGESMATPSDKISPRSDPTGSGPNSASKKGSEPRSKKADRRASIDATPTKQPTTAAANGVEATATQAGPSTSAPAGAATSQPAQSSAATAVTTAPTSAPAPSTAPGGAPITTAAPVPSATEAAAAIVTSNAPEAASAASSLIASGTAPGVDAAKLEERVQAAVDKVIETETKLQLAAEAEGAAADASKADAVAPPVVASEPSLQRPAATTVEESSKQAGTVAEAAEAPQKSGEQEQEPANAGVKRKRDATADSPADTTSAAAGPDASDAQASKQGARESSTASQHPSKRSKGNEEEGKAAEAAPAEDLEMADVDVAQSDAARPDATRPDATRPAPVESEPAGSSEVKTGAEPSKPPASPSPVDGDRKDEMDVEKDLIGEPIPRSGDAQDKPVSPDKGVSADEEPKASASGEVEVERAADDDDDDDDDHEMDDGADDVVVEVPVKRPDEAPATEEEADAEREVAEAEQEVEGSQATAAGPSGEADESRDPEPVAAAQDEAGAKIKEEKIDDIDDDEGTAAKNKGGEDEDEDADEDEASAQADADGDAEDATAATKSEEPGDEAETAAVGAKWRSTPARNRYNSASRTSARSRARDSPASTPGGPSGSGGVSIKDESGRREDSASVSTAPTSAEREKAKRKTTQVLLMLLTEVSNHTHGNLFHNAIKEQDAPDYYTLIRHPLDLKTIKARIKEGTIRSASQLRRALNQMFANSLIYNRPGTEVHRMASEMSAASEEIMDRFEVTQNFNSRR